MNYWNTKVGLRAALMVCTALTATSAMAGAALAQTAAPAAKPSTDAVVTLQEVVVTAQKRSQNLQNVPIAVTALGSKVLAANRITNVLNLAGVVPNLAVRASAGGASLPAFTMRGITSYGVVPGSDKEISIYIDGVYIGSAVASVFDLPDLQRIEVLRGPQGTLFGRNATGGAISLITKDPSSEFHLNQELTAGNYRQFRSKTRIDTGEIGDFSASLSYVHDERLGDIKNRGAGQTWILPASSGEPTHQTSPSTLGAHNINTVFGAVEYKPNNSFKTVLKVDYSTNHYTPAGAGVVGVNPTAPGGAFLAGVVALQTTPIIFSGAKRPDSVNNDFTTPSYSRNYGINLTSDYTINDNFSAKNVLAYRYSFVRAHDQLDGLGGLYVTPALASAFGYPASLIGSPFVALGIEQSSASRQISDEAQLNYKSERLNVTAGLLYFHINSTNGGSPGIENNTAFSVLPGGAFQPGHSRAFNAASSYAVYGQAEYKITDQFEAVGGVRVTKDEKTGSFQGDTGTAIFTPYDQTKPSYLAGLNYKPTDNILIYGKYSTAFVSGGTAGTISFKPETANSWEAGIKSDLFDRRLRINLALFDVKYQDIQSAQSGVNVGHPELGLVIIDLGDSHGRGFELETTAAPMKGLTLGASVGYTDYYFTKVNPGLGTVANPATVNNFSPTLLPRWTANLTADYETQPLFEDMKMDFRMDASWRSKELTNPYPYDNIPVFASVQNAPATWLVNATVALEQVPLPHGYGHAEIDLWAKNLFDDKSITFPDLLGDFVGGSEYQAARTIGVDLKYNF